MCFRPGKGHHPTNKGARASASSVVEVFQSGVDEMACPERHARCEATVRDDCDLLDFAMMLLDELQPSEQCAEVIPAAQCFCVNQYSA
jgi:hypothetical protein